MKQIVAYSIIGGRISPNAIVFGTDAEDAKRRYNDWLKKSYGYVDEGVGVSLLDLNLIHVYEGGLTSYERTVKGNPHHMENKMGRHPWQPKEAPVTASENV